MPLGTYFYGPTYRLGFVGSSECLLEGEVLMGEEVPLGAGENETEGVTSVEGSKKFKGRYEVVVGESSGDGS